MEVPVRPYRPGHRGLHLRFLEIKVAVADECGHRGDAGVQHGLGPVGAAQDDGFFRSGHHRIRRDQQIGRTRGNARRRNRPVRARDADMAHHRAALLRQPGHIQHHGDLAFDMRGHAQNGADGQNARPPNPRQRKVPGALDGGQHGIGQAGHIGPALRLWPAQPAAFHRHERGAKALEAGIILVAGRLVDTPLAAQIGFQRFHRHAVRLHRTIAAAFADRRIDPEPQGWVLQRPALAAAALFGGAGLDIDQNADPRLLTQLQHDGVNFVAVADRGAGCQIGGAK